MISLADRGQSSYGDRCGCQPGSDLLIRIGESSARLSMARRHRRRARGSAAHALKGRAWRAPGPGRATAPSPTRSRRRGPAA